MNEREFNLLNEPWIFVMRLDGTLEEVSLRTLFKNASEFRNLAGELPAQDIAILRLLLAILHVVFARWDVYGNEASIISPSSALQRWKDLHEKGEFNFEVIDNYLKEYEDCFYLFHPERPFYQVLNMGDATDYQAAKLNGELSESGNKLRLFSQRSGMSKSSLKYSEAARWLLYINAFDDTSAKPKTKGLPSPGVGWLGKLGLVFAVGSNLFETLLLNLVLLQDGENKLWGKEHPIWELEKPIMEERRKISVPDNLSELMTLQSRRILLKRKIINGNMEPQVVGYELLGGDFFQKENAFSEQMTVWRYGKTEGSKIEQYMPRRHDPTKQLWRDFPALVLQAEGKRRPGIINWLAMLNEQEALQGQKFRISTVGVKYGDKDFFIENVFSDSITINSSLLADSESIWVNRIVSELDVTDHLVKQVAELSKKIARASGDTSDSASEDITKEQAYFRINIPFRIWLESINPEHDDLDEKCELWWGEAQAIIYKLAREIMERSGPQAFVGRKVKEKIGGKEVEISYTSPEAYNYFLKRTKNRESLKGGRDHE